MSILSASHSRYMIVLTAILAVILAVYLMISVPPSPRPADAPISEFSAERAFSHLTDLLKENVPHPSGSLANAVIRDRIITKMKSWGYETEIQSSFSCGQRETGCARIENIVAVKKGTTDNPAVMLTAHYDSAPATAAAADDGAGIAAMLEIASNFASMPKTKNDIVFLFADGEESGLIGAAEFVRAHPLKDRIGSVVNMEARGVTGASIMFETGPNNSGLMDMFQQKIERPTANSLSYEFYKRMPNDTDYTVYKRHGITGFNFAFSGGVMLYHSVLDDLHHLDKASLQHHGDNTFALVQALADNHVDILQADGDSVYFDLFSLVLVKWAVNWNFGLIAFCFTIVVYSVIICGQHSKLDSYFYSIAGLAVLLVSMIVFGAVLAYPLAHWNDIHGLEHPYPWPGRIALFAASGLSILLVAKWLSERVRQESIANSGALVSVIFSLLNAAFIPGASYVFLVPLLVFSIATVLIFFAKRYVKTVSARYEIATFLATLASAYIAFYHFVMLDAVFNFQLSYLKVLPLFVLAIWVLPLLSEHISIFKKSFNRAATICLASVLVACGVSFLVPGFTDTRPRPMNLVYMEKYGVDEAHWLMDTSYSSDPDFEYLQKTGFPNEREDIQKYYVYPTRSYVKPAVKQNLNAPELDVLSVTKVNGQKKLRVRVTSNRDAFKLGVSMDKKDVVSRVTVNGFYVSHKRRYITLAVGPEQRSHIVEILMAADEPLTVTLLDIAPLTGEAAGQILRLRPSNVKPLDMGDHSVISRQYSL